MVPYGNLTLIARMSSSQKQLSPGPSHRSNTRLKPPQAQRGGTRTAEGQEGCQKASAADCSGPHDDRQLRTADARGATNAARQRTRLKSDDGVGWTDLRLGRAWAVRLPRREIAYVAPARAPGLAGSTSLGSVDARAGPRHSGAPAAVRINEAARSARGLGARGTSSPLRGHGHSAFGWFGPWGGRGPLGPRGHSLRSR